MQLVSLFETESITNAFGTTLRRLDLERCFGQSFACPVARTWAVKGEPMHHETRPGNGSRRVAGLLLTLVVCSGIAAGEESAGSAVGLPTIEAATQGLDRHSGLLDVYLDPQRGRIWLALPPAGAPRGEIGRYLFVEGLVTGLGSNPVGLDRGELGPTRVIILRRVGGRILVEQPNLGFRALTEDAAERRAVAESFATSVLWAGEIVALDEDGSSLIEFTSFVVRDAHDVASRLEVSGQGKFSLDPARSALEVDRCLVFPENLELESTLTWAGDDAGTLVRGVTPEPGSITLVQHHSIITLPDSDYRPRRFDPRAGSFAVGFMDYAVPLDAPTRRGWIVRHRLEKTDPTRERSTVREPIVYHVDPGVPEPVRSALIDGASWWARAFDAAGFVDAYRVELLPTEADPLDVRYNVIEWVHRSTRGWSYGGGVVDPRTGEVIKGHVRLGSLRVRQDRLLFEGLLGTDQTGSGVADDPVELALDRIRQLAAHEVGHTLGFDHNFAASTYGGRASVMDYPAPLVRVGADDRLDTSDAYGVGVGVWDLHAVRFAYAEWPPGADEERELESVIRDGLDRELRFLTDADARPAGAAHPLANLWDNGSDPVAQLEQTMRVRKIALARFGERNVAVGSPLALLEEVLATVYFHHRYQLEAAVKVVGGMDYGYALRGDGQPPVKTIDGDRQLEALRVVLGAMDPEQLVLSGDVLAMLAPRPSGHARNREQFTGSSSPAFDPLAAASTAADMVISRLLQPERCARLVNFHAADPSLPSLELVLDELVRVAFETDTSTEAQEETLHEIQRVLVLRLIERASDASVSSSVRVRLEGALHDLLELLESDGDPTAQQRFVMHRIRGHERRPGPTAVPGEAAPSAPPGSPIGMGPARAGCSAENWTGR